jgi:hypothetical protein
VSQLERSDAELIEPGQLEAITSRRGRSRSLPSERFVDYLLLQAEDPGRRKGERTRSRLKVCR